MREWEVEYSSPSQMAFGTLNEVTSVNSIMIERLACSGVNSYVSIGLSGPIP